MSKGRPACVLLEWTGRAPPLQNRFMAVGRFDALREQWPAVAWSVVLHAPPGGFLPLGNAEAAMLTNDAPADLLRPGSAFDVMEGPHVVARAIVL